MWYSNEATRHNNKDKQPDKRPRIHQAQVAQPAGLTGLVALPSALARLQLSFLPDRAIPSLLGVSHTARRLCACQHELDVSSCEELDDVRFISSLMRLRTLDLRDCNAQLVYVSPLSPLTSLNALGCIDDVGYHSQLVDVSPLSSLVALETLHLVGCVQLSDVSHLTTLTSLTSLNLRFCHQLSDVSPLSALTSLTSLDLSNWIS